MKFLYLFLSILIVLFAIACGDDSIVETTNLEKIETTAAADTSRHPLNTEFPEMMLNDTDHVTNVQYINGVRLLGGDEKFYHIRIAFLDVAGTEFTGKACYFDAIDLSTNTLVAHKRLAGASTVCYAINDKNFLTIWVTSLSYRTENNHMTIRSDPFNFTCMTAIGESIDPSFLVLDNANMFSKGGLDDPNNRQMLQLYIENFLDTLLDSLDQRKDKYTYLMSNDRVFLDYCGERAPSMGLIAEMWQNMNSVQSIMDCYGIR